LRVYGFAPSTSELHAGVDPGGAIATPKTYNSNSFHHDFLQFGKPHSRYHAILPSVEGLIRHTGQLVQLLRTRIQNCSQNRHGKEIIWWNRLTVNKFLYKKLLPKEVHWAKLSFCQFAFIILLSQA